MTEAEVLRHFKAQPQELGLKAFSTIHEENKNTNLFPVGLDGLPASVVASIRKMRLYQETSVAHNELLLQPPYQIDADQGKEMYDHAVTQLLKTREGGLKQQGKILQASQLFQISENIEETKRTAMDAMTGTTHDAEDDEESDEFGGHTTRKPSVVVQAPTAAGMLGSLGASSAKKAASTKRAAGKRKKKDMESDDESVADGSDLGQKGEDITNLAARDPDMAKVMSKHASIKGRPFHCFSVLSVAAFLRNAKHGKALQGVAFSDT